MSKIRLLFISLGIEKRPVVSGLNSILKMIAHKPPSKEMRHFKNIYKEYPTDSAKRKVAHYRSVKRLSGDNLIISLRLIPHQALGLSLDVPQKAAASHN